MNSILAYLRSLISYSPSGHESALGTTLDIPRFVDRLMQSTPEAFVIIDVVPEVDFVQFQGDSKGVRLNFPVITSRQKSLKESVVAAIQASSLQVMENRGSDGALMIECDIDGNSQLISTVIVQFLGRVFQVTDATRLKFTAYGLAVKEPMTT